MPKELAENTAEASNPDRQIRKGCKEEVTPDMGHEG